MTRCATHARNEAPLPPRKPPETDPESDEEDDEEFDDEVDDDFEDAEEDDEEDDEEGQDEGGDEEEDDEEGDDAEDLDDAEDEPPEEPAEPAASRPRARREPQTRARGLSGMGRPSTGPRIRRPAPPPVEPSMSASASSETEESELAPDIADWPGTAEAARMVGRHTSTIKLWRAQGRIRAVQDGSGCWKYHPDDLAESMDAPDGTDPGSILAQGMSAIVSQGGSAHERLLAMTELATDGLKDATKVLAEQLKAAYAHIRDLEKELKELRGKMSVEELRHERQMRKLDHKHELDIVGAKETSERLNGLLTVLGPIAASIGQRVLGNITGAETLEAEASGFRRQASGGKEDFGPRASGFSGAAPPNPQDADGRVGGQAPEPPSGPRPGPPEPSEAKGWSRPQTPNPSPPSAPNMPFEARITQAMARLCDVIRRLDEPAFAGLRAMMPPKVADALDAVKKASDDGTVGRALAVIVQAAQGLSDLQFRALRPIAPADIAAVLGELREILKDADVKPSAGEPS